MSAHDHATPSTPAAPPRPHLDERRAYVPRARVERFIVPLLAAEIPRAIREHAAPSGRVLDVGCGRQPFRPLLESLGLRYRSLDTQQNPDQPVDFVAAIDAPPTPELLAAGPFELILCTEVLEHVADWHAAFTTLAALLAPGGRLIITAPAFYPLHEEPYDFWRPTSHALAHFAGRHHLRVIELKRLGTTWDVLGTALGGLSARSAGARPWSWLIAALVRPWRSPLLWLLRSGVLQRHVATGGKLYLSNLAVLEKP